MNTPIFQNFTHRIYQTATPVYNAKTESFEVETESFDYNDLFVNRKTLDDDLELVYALSELVNPIDLLKLNVGESLSFNVNRDSPELGTVEIFRTK